MLGTFNILDSRQFQKDSWFSALVKKKAADSQHCWESWFSALLKKLLILNTFYKFFWFSAPVKKTLSILGNSKIPVSRHFQNSWCSALLRVLIQVLVAMTIHTRTANPTWGDIFDCCFKANSSKLERLFSLKSGKRDVRALSFELWNSIRKCHPKWNRLYNLTWLTYWYIWTPCRY